MKLILCLTLIWMLSNSAESLRCIVALNRDNGTSQTCEVSHQCGSYTYQESRKHAPSNPQKIILKSCVPSSLCKISRNQIFSFSHPSGVLTSSVQCCNTDDCNSKSIPYPEVYDKKNSLQCYGCTSGPQNVNVCNETVHCVGKQDRCISLNVTNALTSTQIHRGCATANVCDTLSKDSGKYILHSANISVTKCCQNSFCNSAWNVEVNVVLLLFGLVGLIVY